MPAKNNPKKRGPKVFINHNLRFKEVIELMKKDKYSIQTALQKLNYDKGTFYRNLNKEQKRLIDEAKAANTNVGKKFLLSDYDGRNEDFED